MPRVLIAPGVEMYLLAEMGDHAVNREALVKRAQIDLGVSRGLVQTVFSRLSTNGDVVRAGKGVWKLNPRKQRNSK